MMTVEKHEIDVIGGGAAAADPARTQPPRHIRSLPSSGRGRRRPGLRLGVCLLKAQQEMRIARDAVQLGDDRRSTVCAASLEGFGKLRPVRVVGQ